jgi:hypothetical protein
VDINDGFNEISFASIPLFDKNQNDKHFYFDRPSLKLGDAYNRLRRKYQKYKQVYYLENKKEAFQVYDALFDVDYNVDNGKDKFLADSSFTYLHWRVMEMLNLSDKHPLKLKSLS